MAYKYFGTLTGKTYAAQAQTLTTPPEHRNPYTEFDAGTKFFAWGEAATSDAMNRVATALSANLDYQAGMLDTPALRKDVLFPFADAATGFAGSGKYGFPELAISDPAAMLAAGNVEVNLGAQDSASSIEPPAVWVYVGLQKQALAEGSVLRLHRDQKKSANESGGDQTLTAAYGSEIKPVYVKRNSGASDYHGSEDFLGASPHSPSDWIPPIAPIDSDLPPYAGSASAENIGSWKPDGLTLASGSFDALYVRPGCFALIGSSGDNNGLYLVRSVTKDKAVLTRGNLTKITLTSGGGASFTAGQMVSWADPPSNTSGSLGMHERSRRAYVVYKDTDTLWLMPFGSGENISHSTNAGSRVASTVSTADSIDQFWSSSFNDVGLVDQESGADGNHLLPVGTKLYADAFTSIAATTNAEVTAVEGPATPVVFDTDAATGTITPCAPPGFLLNPVIGLGDHTAAAHHLWPGNYMVDCKTMTTVREQLMSSGLRVSRAAAENPDSILDGGDFDFQHGQLKALFNHLHKGNGAAITNSELLNEWFTQTRSILGGSLWLITADDGAGTGAGEKVVDGTVSPGDRLTFESHPTLGCGDAVGTIVTGWDEYIVVRDVYRSQSWDDDKYPDYVSHSSIGSTGSFDIDGTPYTITALVAPQVKTGTGGDTTEVGPLGLNAVYNLLNDADHYSRNRGLGNFIELKDTRPLTFITPNTSTNVFKVRGANADGDTSLLSIEDTSGNVEGIQALLSQDWYLGAAGKKLYLTDQALSAADVIFDYTTDSLRISDLNAFNIDLSSATSTIIPTEYQDETILGALDGALIGDADQTLISHSVVDGAVVTDASGGSPAIDITSAVMICHGAKYEVGAESGMAITGNATKYVAYKISTGAYVELDAHDLALREADTDHVFIAKVVTNASAVTGVTDIRKRVSRMDEHDCITVGNMGMSGTYAESMTHFETLSDACAAIQVWANEGELTITGTTDATPIEVTTANPHGLKTGAFLNISGHETGTPAISNAVNGNRVVTVTGANTFTIDGSSSHGAGAGGGSGVVLARERAWKIKVVGHVTESTTVDIPCDGITIEGTMPTVSSARPPVIQVTAAVPLFDLKSRSSVELKNLAVTFTASNLNPTGTDPESVFLVNTGGTGTTFTGVRLDNVWVSRASAGVWMSGVGQGTGAMDIYNCVFLEVTNTGITITGDDGDWQQLRVRDCTVEQKGTAATNNQDGISIANCKRVFVDNTVVRANDKATSSFPQAMDLNSIDEKLVVSGCLVEEATDGVGLLIDSCGKGWSVSGCTFREIDYSASPASALKVTSTTGGSIRGCTFSNVTSGHGIEIATGSHEVSVVGNVFDTVGLSAVSLSSSTENCVIDGNSVYNPCSRDISGTAGIWNEGGENTISNNLVDLHSTSRSNVTDAIHVEGAAGEHCAVLGNTVDNGGGVSTWDINSDSPSTRIEGNATHGGDIITSGPSATIVGNDLGGGSIEFSGPVTTVSGNATGGGDIEGTSAADNSVVSGNNLTGSDGTALDIDSVNAATDTLVGTVVSTTDSSPIVVNNVGHGLSSGNAVTIDSSGNDYIDGDWIVDVLDADNFSLRGSEAPGTTVATGNINKIDFDCIIETTVPHGYSTGQHVVISGSAVSEVNGVWSVTVTASDLFTLDGCFNPTTDVTSQGTVTAVNGGRILIQADNTTVAGNNTGTGDITVSNVAGCAVTGNTTRGGNMLVYACTGCSISGNSLCTSSRTALTGTGPSGQNGYMIIDSNCYDLVVSGNTCWYVDNSGVFIKPGPAIATSADDYQSNITEHNLQIVG